MRRIVILVTVLALMIAMTSVVSASVKPIIKGSGVAENNFSGGVFPFGTVGIGGFNADEKDGVDKGKVKFKVMLPDGSIPSELQGLVVCYQMTTTVPGGQGWELRFQVTSSSGVAAVPVGAYGSIYVQDNGKTGDMIDEVFDPDDLWKPDCGLNDLSVTWENMLEGGIKIK